MTIVFAKPIPLAEVERRWEAGEMSRGEAISHVIAWVKREIDPAWPEGEFRSTQDRLTGDGPRGAEGGRDVGCDRDPQELP